MRAEPLSTDLEVGEPTPAPVGVLDFVSLAKPRLSSLVLFTAAGGMWLAHRGASIDVRAWLLTLLGTAGTVASANALNCIIERDSDRFMARTADRPLARRRLPVSAALAFALGIGLVSLPMIYVGSNLLTAALGLLALLSYAFAYTPLKSRSHWAMYVGAVPGALPPLMGWTAITGSIDAPGLALFALLFVWQLPHFIAIALFRKNEYLAAGLTSLPLEKGDLSSQREAVAWIALLVPVSLLPYFVNVAGVAFLVIASVLGAGLLAIAVMQWKALTPQLWGKRLFRASLLYLTAMFVALVL